MYFEDSGEIRIDITIMILKYKLSDGRIYSTAHAELNASVEYERFYSRVSMCKTRALVLELASLKDRTPRTRALERSYSYSSAPVLRLDSN